ncbi:hypothetical protein BU17DRAFT_64231 [Hysterangium stoloniferum]|nr:hypothetical protein BU17DRAFT_64231 [Hysterangium stoloniferum]
MSSFNEPTLANHNEATIQSYLEGIVEAICHVRQLSVEELTAIGRCIEFGYNHDTKLLTYHIKQLNVVSSLIGPIVSQILIQTLPNWDLLASGEGITELTLKLMDLAECLNRTKSKVGPGLLRVDFIEAEVVWEVMMYLGIAATVKKLQMEGVTTTQGKERAVKSKTHEPGTDGMFVDRAAHCDIERGKQEWRWSRACALWYTGIRGRTVQLQSQLHFSFARRQESPTWPRVPHNETGRTILCTTDWELKDEGEVIR